MSFELECGKNENKKRPGLAHFIKKGNVLMGHSGSFVVDLTPPSVWVRSADHVVPRTMDTVKTESKVFGQFR